MTRELPKENSGSEYIQFRGRQTSVSLDQFGIRFTTEPKETPDDHPGLLVHEPLPVATREEIQAGDAPANAVAEEVAEQLVHGELSNPLICYGVVCEYHSGDGEICGKVFDTPESLNGHMGSHYKNQKSASDQDAESEGDN